MKTKKTLIHLEFTEESTVRLRGRQSVRTTFKLSERCIDALSILAGQMGIKQKTLFDHLVDDVQALKAIAGELDSLEPPQHRVAKTFVISRSTLENLEAVCSRYNAPRDALVEFSIERILPLIEQEKQRHAKRTALANKLTVQIRKGLELLKEAEEELGGNDPLVQELYSMLEATDASYRRIQAFLEKSKRIEEF